MKERLLIITILAVLLLFLVNFRLEIAIFNTVKTIIAVAFILFFSGYLLVRLLFRKLETSEEIILSIGLSISLVILTAMLLHFTKSEITAVNIINVLLIVIIVLLFGNAFKTTQKKELGKKFQIKDKNFLFLIILTIAVLTVIIYISSTLPSKEEFVEIYWKISNIENLTNTSQTVCEIGNCSISGFSMVGDINMAGEEFKTIIIDPEKANNYEYFCIDTNRNNVYCEKMEGPFKYNDSFLINDKGFSVMKVNENNLIVANYPKEVNVSNFKVGFLAKSYHKTSINLNMGLLVDDVLKDSKTISLNPKEETLEYFTVDLQEKGEHRVRVAALPINLNKRIYIDFWVKRD